MTYCIENIEATQGWQKDSNLLLQFHGENKALKASKASIVRWIRTVIKDSYEAEEMHTLQELWRYPGQRKGMSHARGSTSEGEKTFNHNNGPQKTNRWGLVATGVVGGTLLAVYAVATPFVAPALRKMCLPYVPASEIQVENVLKMLQFRSGTIVDIGSGDGRIVIAAAKKGFQAVGYELNPWLVWYSRYRARREGVHKNTKFYISDLWKMPQLEKKLQMELSVSATVIACRFPFPCWTPDNIFGQGIDTVWVYNMKKLNESGINRISGQIQSS
ncbi:ATP synthase subunit C lysine N-methyltransferase isoform X3 [Engystomops pustulosus]|uniref:ATP synthase subunit C lysine N-methyltransferase isoform X3 n=1 Tax=Engystomops pustulosus TaxID=76066 RepID=UPI003AFB4973